MSLREEAIRGVKWSGLSSFAGVSIQTFRTIILARLLSPEDFGLMGMVMVVIGFAQAYIDLGISSAIIHRQDATKEQLSSLYWLNVLVGGLIFVIVLFLTPLVVIFFGEPRLAPLIVVVGAILIITPFGSQFYVLLQRDLNFNTIVKQEIAASLVGLLVAVICAFYGYGVWSLVWGVLTEASCRTAYGIKIGLARYRPLFHLDRHDLKGYIGFGMYQIGERSVNYLSQRLDQVLVGKLLGVEPLGYYNFAFNLVAQPVSRINPVVTRVAFPVFAKVQNETDKLRKGYIKIIKILTSVNAPILIGISAVAPLAVPLIFGEKWSPSIILVQILALVSLCRSSGNPIGSLQLAKGRADLGFKWNVALFAVSLPMVYIGGAIGKGIGIAISLLILQICSYAPSYIFLVRPLIGDCLKEYGAAIIKPIAIAGAMSLIILLLPYFLDGISAFLILMAEIGLGAVLYLLFLWVLDRKIIKEFREMLFARTNSAKKL
jgi:lipopolysaccharide exporter